jgi:uridine kinase
MPESSVLHDPEAFSALLFERMKRINAAVRDMELYEFRYGLDNLYPKDGGWASVRLAEKADVEEMVNSREFYTGIQIKPRLDGRIVLDSNIVGLTNMLFVGLVTGKYSQQWVRSYFYFDVRGFLFLHRTVYFTDGVLEHLGGHPLRCFTQKQKLLARCQAVGYKAFKEANAEVDQFFIESVKKLIAAKGTPIVLAIAGATAAGKTEIVARLRSALEQDGRRVSAIEMDNFLTDREQREEKGIFSLGKAAIHFDLFKLSLEDISRGRKIAIPRYDFIFATSSHDLQGNLKPGGSPIEIEPADVVFIEGNFPFLLEEAAPLIGIKVVYLTDDEVRLKRKWIRDIDYRKKYEPTYFRNRFFKDQFLMAQTCLLPQLEVCDMVVDTTGAALWVTPHIAAMLSSDWDKPNPPQLARA